MKISCRAEKENIEDLIFSLFLARCARQVSNKSSTLRPHDLQLGVLMLRRFVVHNSIGRRGMQI